MPRYEFKEGKSSKFWEIELDGESFTTRWGKIGTTGQETSKDFDTRADARREYDKLIAEKTKKGYLLVSDGGGDAPPVAKSNPELEAKIDADPEDLHAYEVYADWLQAAGDARGELIALQLALAKESDTKLLGRQKTLLDGESDEFFYGDLNELLPDGARVTWRYGFWDTVRVSLGYDEADDVDIGKILAATMRHPSGRFLRGLTVGMFNHEGENHYPVVTSALAKAGPKPSLRSLFLGDFEYPDETEISWAEVGDVSKVWALYPNLEKLELQGAAIALGKIDAPKLKSLILRTGGLPTAALKSVAAAKLPSLEHLEIWLGDDNYGGDSTFEDFAPLLSEGRFPALRHLGVVNCAYVGKVVAVLARTGLLAQLKSLDLSKGTLVDSEASVIEAEKIAFSHLASLDLSENILTDEGAQKLAGVCEKVDISGQRAGDMDEDEDSRYVAVGE